MNGQDTRHEKLALLALAAGSIIALTWIALKAMSAEKMDPNSATLVGAIAAGLIAFGKDIVAAIRTYAMNAQLSKVTDQLAGSRPADGANDNKPTGAPGDPVHVKEEDAA